jgi:hypothetical protein
MKTGLALFALAVAAVAQTPGPTTPAITVAAGQLSATAPATGGIITSFAGGLPFQPVAGHPYSAEQVMEHVQTLADGTHITQTMQTIKLYRDSAGRTRTEHIFTPPPGAVMASGPSFIQIADPLAGYRYVLDSRSQTARRAPWPPVMQRLNVAAPANQARPAIPPPAAASARPHPDMSRESLGTQTIEGVLAEGTRRTTTFPAGLVGNDRPITTVSETWMSPDLKMVVLSKISDPRNGESTTKLTNIVMAEPDPALFQVPADYSIVDEPAPVIR